VTHVKLATHRATQTIVTTVYMLTQKVRHESKTRTTDRWSKPTTLPSILQSISVCHCRPSHAVLSIQPCVMPATCSLYNDTPSSTHSKEKMYMYYVVGNHWVHLSYSSSHWLFISFLLQNILLCFAARTHACAILQGRGAPCLQNLGRRT